MKKFALRALSNAIVFVALELAVFAHSAHAEWPARTITIIVPFGSDGHTDMLGRLLAAQLASKLGQNVTIENRVGDGGNIGLNAAASAAATGYTLVVTSNAVLINPSTSKRAKDPLRDFAPIAYLGAAANVIVTRSDSGITSLQDLIVKAKASPGRLTYASPGVGTCSQLAVELLKAHSKIDIRHVPFNGSGMSLMAATSGGTDVAVLSTGSLIGHIRKEKLRALVQTGSERWIELPDVPTMAEVGIPNAVVETSQMLLAPAGTPAQIIDLLAKKTREILQEPDFKARMLETGFVVKYEGPEDLRARMVRELPMWRKLVESASLK
jgi:tripartite-type tricarboxylate transporter receptor subunit TctC